MDNKSFPLTGRQKNQMLNIIERPLSVPDFALTGAKNPNLRVFVANFDGTQNDRESIAHGEQQTLVAKNQDKITAMANPAIESKYYRGVGTTKLPITRIIQSATGMGCITNAERAHADLCEQVEQWRKENPNVEVHVHVAGFSRGSSTALHFLNLVYDRGAFHKGDERRFSDSRMAPGLINSSAVLLDTVSTGQAERLKLTVPASCVAALHLVAQDEQRLLFPLREISAKFDQEISLCRNASMKEAKATLDGGIHYNRIQEVSIPGVHSDIGGSYADGGISMTSEFLMDYFQQSLGFGLTPIKPTIEHIQKCRLHDPRFDFERFFGGTAPKQNTKRSTQKAQTDHWDGNWGLKTSIDGMPESLPPSFETRAPSQRTYFFDKPIFTGDEIAFLGKTAQIILMHDLGGTESSPDQTTSLKNIQVLVAVNESDCKDPLKSFDFREDGLYIFGKKSSGCPTASELRALWNAEISKGLPPTAITISIDAWRIGTSAITRQLNNVSAPPIPAIPTDPWPREVRAVVMLLNSDIKIKPQKASKLLLAAGNGSANKLLTDFPDIVSLRAIPHEGNADGPKSMINPFTLVATDSKGNTFSSNDPINPVTMKIQESLNALARGLDEVSLGLLKSNIQTQPNEPFCFIRSEMGAKSDMGTNKISMIQDPNTPLPSVTDFGEITVAPPSHEQNLTAKLKQLRKKRKAAPIPQRFNPVLG